MSKFLGNSRDELISYYLTAQQKQITNQKKKVMIKQALTFLFIQRQI